MQRQQQQPNRIRIFILLLFAASALAQTFQYSRGWTNGKKRAQLMGGAYEDLFNWRPNEEAQRQQPIIASPEQVNNEDAGKAMIYGEGRCSLRAVRTADPELLTAPNNED